LTTLLEDGTSVGMAKGTKQPTKKIAATRTVESLNHALAAACLPGPDRFTRIVHDRPEPQVLFVP
jgi:hypothetical protein